MGVASVPGPVVDPRAGIVSTAAPRYLWSASLRQQLKYPRSGHTGSGMDAINSLRPTPNISPFADDIFKCIFLNENLWILPRISLKYVPKVRINNIPALVQIMAWRRPGDKPLSEPMMVSLLTHIYTSLGLNELIYVRGTNTYVFPLHLLLHAFLTSLKHYNVSSLKALWRPVEDGLTKRQHL